MALGVQYAAGVPVIHRNLVTLKPKAGNNNPNPVLKYDAAALLAKTFRNRTRPNLVITRRESRIMATADLQERTEISSSSGSDLSDSYTVCYLDNETDFVLKYNKGFYWHGDGRAPGILIPRILPWPPHFVHNADGENRSVGGLWYSDRDESVNWIVAWSNVPHKKNKVLTKIRTGKEPIDWNEIYDDLTSENTENTGSDENADLGYQADITINPFTDKPRMEAKIYPLGKPAP